MQLTEDEAALIAQMRTWKDGIPTDAVGQGKESAVYVSLMAARAELLIMAIRHGHNDLSARYDRFHKLLSAHSILALCQAWESLRERESEDDKRAAGAA